ncbi:MAG: EamA family transporter [Actinomycetota bacterium]
MNTGALWALVAAITFAFLQASNRKTNQLVDAYRTSFGLLVAVEIILLARALVTGELGLLLAAPASAVALFGVATFFHFIGGWTLLALSQQRIGVARTGALVASAPLFGTLLAAIFLDEPLTVAIVTGVLLAVVGLVLISLSGKVSDVSVWRQPWLGLTVALIWGITPILLRAGFERFDHPVAGLTIGMGVSIPLYALLLTLWGAWRNGPVPARALRWRMAGGVFGAIAVSAQWISFDLTTIAISITVQQLSVLFVIALVPLRFKQPFERMNRLFFTGAVAVLAGSITVVLA